MAAIPVFVGTVDARGSLDFAPAVRGLMRAHLLRLKPGTPIEVTLKRWRNKRSSQANRYYFGVVIPLIAEHCGYDKQEMHELLAMRFLRIEDDPITGAPRRTSTPETDSQEFADYVDHCIQFAAELGIEIPEPTRLGVPT
jgi:hypothetical protein